MATKHYQQSWVLLNHPEFRSSYKPVNLAPLPPVVMYSKVAPPRNKAPGFETAPPTTRPLNPLAPVSEPTVAHAIHDGLVETRPRRVPIRIQRGAAPPGVYTYQRPPPRPHGVSGSVPGYTQSGVVPQTPMNVKTISVAPDRQALRAKEQSARREEVVKEKRLVPIFKVGNKRDRRAVPEEHEALIKRLRNKAAQGP